MPIKRQYFIPPVLTIGVLGAWVTGQRHEISELEEQVIVLKREISTALPNSESQQIFNLDERLKLQKKSSQIYTPDGKIRWAWIGEKIKKFGNTQGQRETKLMLEFQALIFEMDGQNLAEAIREIRALSLDETVRSTLEDNLLTVLSEKDPATFLKLEEDSLSENENQWRLRDAFEYWLNEDITAATIWFEQKMAQRKFETKSLNPSEDNRYAFEGALITKLLETGVSGAQNRLKKMPPEEQKTILRQSYQWDLDDKNMAEYAQLLREYLPRDEQALILGEAVENSFQKDRQLNQVSQHLKEVSASSEERVAIVKSISTQIQHERDDRLDDYVSWIQKEAPEEKEILGNTIAYFAVNQKRVTDAIAKIQELNDESITSSFLSQIRHPLEDSIREELLSSITNKELRDSLVK